MQAACRVVITGGAGFIGANLARSMLDAGMDVTVLDDLSTGFADNLDQLDVRLVEGSILDRGLVDRAFAGADAVVHLAALPSVPRSVADPVTTHHVNATGTLEVLEAVRRAGGPYLVVASSSSVYGANPAMPKHEEMRTAPLSPYAVSKLATEAYALSHAYCYGLEVLAFRFFNVFGPLQRAGHAYAAVVPMFVDAALSGQPIPLHGDGTQTRDFTYVGSVARVITEAVRRRVTCPDPVNLAFGSRTSLLELVALLEAVLGHRLDRASLPPRPGDVPHSQADRTRLQSLFPDVEPVPFDVGVEATLRWFEQVRGTSPVRA
jgi:UDP-glucose 4-epimerase